MEYTSRFIVKAPLAAVAAVHNNTRALQWLSPPPVIVQFHKVDPLGEDSMADFTMWLGPLPVRWLAHHTDYDPLTGFTDTQMSGPFKKWVHRHTFRPIDETTTEVIDHVVAELKPHLLWGPVGLFMWLNLKVLFAYRKFQTQRHAKGVSHAVV